VLAFALLVSVLTGLLFGLLPSWQASRLPDVARRLREEASGVSGDAARSRTRQALVTAELALALVLLAGAGLLIRSFVHLSRVDLGIRTEGVLTFAVSLPDATYGARERRAAFVDQLLDRLSALPGAESAGATFGMPLTGFGYVISVSELDGRRLESSESDDLSLQVRAVTPDYFPTMGMELVRGRGVASGDRSGTPPVVVVNQTAARLLWPGADPLGRRVIIGTRLGLGGERAGGEVVGVIADVRENGPAAAPRPTMYLSLAQWPLGYLGVAVRTSGEPASLATPIRQAVAALDPDIPIFQVRTLEDLAANAVAQPRLYASVLGLFAFAATLLAVVGVYGVVTRALQQRLREVGIRMALGARPLEVQRLLVRQGLVPVWLGVGIGLVGARALTRLLTRLLFQVGSADPATLAGAAALLVMVAALATYLPAWRATSLDPMAVLRQE
jgi:predicted permease